LLVGAVAVFFLSPGSAVAGAVPAFAEVLTWIRTNLGFSLPVFGLLLALFIGSLRKLSRAVAVNAAIEEVAQFDHWVDTWISLFFGVGVIWTAIGMRSALIYALGDPESTLDLGAYAILERMVEGGILLALSTTIFGGIGGYVLRVVKALTVETKLKGYYDRLAHAPGLEMQLTLEAIEGQLRRLTHISSEQEEIRHDRAGVVSRTAQ
jgi:hypothetical protein